MGGVKRWSLETPGSKVKKKNKKKIKKKNFGFQILILV